MYIYIRFFRFYVGIMSGLFRVCARSLQGFCRMSLRVLQGQLRLNDGVNVGFFLGVYVPAARVSTCKRILKIEKHTPIPALWPMRVCRNVSRSALEPSCCSTFNYNEATVRVTKKEQKRGFHQLSRKTLGHSLSAVRFDILPIQYKPWWNIRNLFMNWGHFLG